MIVPSGSLSAGSFVSPVASRSWSRALSQEGDRVAVGGYHLLVLDPGLTKGLLNSATGMNSRTTVIAVANEQRRGLGHRGHDAGTPSARGPQPLDVELLHLQHRLHRALRPLRVGVGESLLHPPGVTCQESPYLSVSQPHWPSLPPSAVNLSRVVVDLVLILAADLEGDRLVELELGAAVDPDEALARARTRPSSPSWPRGARSPCSG